MIAVFIGLGLFGLVVLALVRMGCRAIRDLCAQLERDRQAEYRYPVPAVPRRSAPQWLRAEPSVATRFARSGRGALLSGRSAVGEVSHA